MNIIQKIKNSGKNGLVGALTTGAIFSSGCTKPINEGIVYEKFIEPERTWVQFVMLPQVHSSGGSTFTTYMFVPIFHHDDEDFVLRIRGTNPKTGKPDSTSFYVNQRVYDSLGIGGYVCFSSDCMERKDFDIKRRATNEEQKKYPVEENKNRPR